MTREIHFGGLCSGTSQAMPTIQSPDLNNPNIFCEDFPCIAFRKYPKTEACGVFWNNPPQGQILQCAENSFGGALQWHYPSGAHYPIADLNNRAREKSATTRYVHYPIVEYG